MATSLEQLGSLHDPDVLAGLEWLGTLPDWLSAISDSQRVVSALLSQVPEFSSGALGIDNCVVERIRLKKDRWIALYRLTVARPGAGQPRQVRIRGTLAPPGLPEDQDIGSAGVFAGEDWRCYLPQLRLALQLEPPDEALPSLPQLADPPAARLLLEKSLQSSGPVYEALHLVAVSPHILRYKPGSRCTILYNLEYPGELARAASDFGWPETVVVKTYEGSKGKNAYRAMQALWNSSLSGGDAVTIAEPLAFVPELNILVQRGMPGEETLKDQIRTTLLAPTPAAMTQLSTTMRRTALGLAALHQSEVAEGEARTWEREFAEAQELSIRLGALIPGLASAVEPLLFALASAAARHPREPLRPGHGSFRPAQVLVNKGGIGFMDFDGFCQAEPARDLALFLWNIKSVGLNTPGEDADAPIDARSQGDYLDQLESIATDFLRSYSEFMPTSPSRLTLWETLNLITLVLEYWVKVKPERLKNMAFLLDQYIRAGKIA